MVHCRKGAHTAPVSGTPGRDRLISCRWSRKTESQDRRVTPLTISLAQPRFSHVWFFGRDPPGGFALEGFRYVLREETCYIFL